MESNLALNNALPPCPATVRTAIDEYVHRVIEQFGDEMVSITLYGSQARGDAGPESDIDLFLVVHHDSPDLRRRLSDLAWDVECEHGVVFSNILRSVERLREMQANRFPFFQSIEQEGIVLWTNASVTTLAIG